MNEMIVDKNDKFLFQSFRKISSERKNSKFRILGLNEGGLKFAKGSFKDKKYFDCEVFVDKELVIKGENCFFDNIDPANSDADLVVNWTEKG